MAIVYLSLGTNLGDRKENLNKAIRALEQTGTLLECSSFIETEPWHFTSPHPFLNACLCLATQLTPQDLLTATQLIETSLGRQHKTTGHEYQDRIIDIDILFYDDIVVTTPRLTIPHPLLHQREFVLVPLAEIAPYMIHPVLHKTITNLLEELSENHTKIQQE